MDPRTIAVFFTCALLAVFLTACANSSLLPEDQATLASIGTKHAIKASKHPVAVAQRVVGLMDVIAGATNIGASKDAVSAAANLWIDQQNWAEEDKDDLKAIVPIALRGFGVPTVEGPVTINEVNKPYVDAVIKAVRDAAQKIIDDSTAAVT